MHAQDDRFRPIPPRAAPMDGAQFSSRVFERIQELAATSEPVLVHGETGTGRERAALSIHYAGPRATAPFVTVSCSEYPEEVLAAEIFGETGVPPIGRIGEAEGGTLCFDDIDALSLPLQIRLLELIRHGTYHPAGTPNALAANVRIIATTSADLPQEAREHRFRNDLCKILNHQVIHLRSLRERRDDIPQLAELLVGNLAGMMGRPTPEIAPEALEALVAADWPGNLPQLENALEHAMLQTRGATIHERHLPEAVRSAAAEEGERPASLPEQVERLEKRLIIRALARQGGKVAGAARELGITPRMVRYKMKKLGIDVSKYSNRA